MAGFCSPGFLEKNSGEETYIQSRLAMWRLQPSELVTAHGPRATGEHVSSLVTA